ncbi:MAG TPA: hotdog domain-containing protein [Acidimicrobiales bacterium]|nr:hotdog domain-containing protein [Acidimicrobiales bacterium]
MDLPDGFDDGLTQYFGLAARRASDETMSTWIELRPDLVDASGAALVGVIAYLVDSAVGMAAGFAALPQWVVTADMDLHLVARAMVGPLRADSRVVRAGTRQVLADCTVYDEGSGVTVASATANHSVLSPERAAPMSVPPPDQIFRHAPAGSGPQGPSGPLSGKPRVPLLERYGIRPVADLPAAAELDITGPARNPWGILHGSLFALVVEAEVASVRPGARIDDLIVRFVAPARVGPARAQATHVGGNLWRVDVRDVGNDNRVCCTSLARVS